MPKKKEVKKARKRGGASVLCPTCAKPTQVVITRRESEGGAVRRVRQCVGRTKHKFTTLEKVNAA